VGDEVSLAVLVLCGAVRHESLLALLDGGLRLLAPGWRLDVKLLCAAEAGLRSVIGPPAIHTFSFIELLNRGRHSALWKWRPSAP
jgi:hypothetical protein